MLTLEHFFNAYANLLRISSELSLGISQAFHSKLLRQYWSIGIRQFLQGLGFSTAIPSFPLIIIILVTFLRSSHGVPREFFLKFLYEFFWSISNTFFRIFSGHPKRCRSLLKNASSNFKNNISGSAVSSEISFENF